MALWIVTWRPTGDRVLVYGESKMDAFTLAQKHRPSNATGMEDIDPYADDLPRTGLRILGADLYRVILLDEQGSTVLSYVLQRQFPYAVKADAVEKAVQRGYAIKSFQWVNSRRIIVRMYRTHMKNPVDARQHARNVAVSRPGGSRTSNVISRLNNPVAYLVELRDLSGTRMGGIRVSAQTIAEARKIAKASMAKRGLKIKYEWSEFTDQSGETIIPATVLPTIARNPAYASNCYRWW
jgi:hypothetical protein